MTNKLLKKRKTIKIIVQKKNERKNKRKNLSQKKINRTNYKGGQNYNEEEFTQKGEIIEYHDNNIFKLFSSWINYFLGCPEKKKRAFGAQCGIWRPFWGCCINE